MAEQVPTRYLSIGDIKKYWLEHIAPNYFDFENINNYNVGIFGYVNEVMGESVEDSFNATNIARREFYPVSAEYMSSLYKMATLQQLDIPHTTPATCAITLVLLQREVLEHSTYSNGVYTCVLDSCMKIMADNLQFMLDYPIVILSKKTKSGWSYTVHYDTTIKNSLVDKDVSQYIATRTLRDGGASYLLLQIPKVRQVTMTRQTDIIIKDSILDTTSIEVNYDGNLANFEVFYTANQTTPQVQLQKVLLNGRIPSGPFCYYEYVNDTKIRLTFPGATSFVPEFNSEIETVIYTSEGEDGNFDKFDGELVCTSDSEDYPYNGMMTIIGLTNGSSSGGKDQQLDEQFRTEIIRAYATNRVYSTSNDLQIFFDRTAENVENMRVLFRKKRDDALYRLFAAYILMKDNLDNIVPTNTLDLDFLKSDVMAIDSVANRVMIKPGTKFVYMEPDSTSNYKAVVLKNPEDAEGYKFVFTNPFLIGINLSPNAVGYYLNSIDTRKIIEYTYVNDETAFQFIAGDFHISRNAMIGCNYYEIRFYLTPANEDFDPSVIITENPFSSETDADGNTVDTNGIRAAMNGKVLSTNFVYEQIPMGYDAEGNALTTSERYCFLKTIIEYENGAQDVILSSNTFCEENKELRTGYRMKFNPGDTFIKGDVLATRLVTDLGKLKAVGDLSEFLYANGLYIPFQIEATMEISGRSSFTMVARLSTDDMIDTSAHIIISDGIYNRNGTPNNSVSIQMDNLTMQLYAFYLNDDVNFDHKWAQFPYLTGYTLTNSYTTDGEDPIDLIQSLSFIRSTMGFYELPEKSEEPESPTPEPEPDGDDETTGEIDPPVVDTDSTGEEDADNDPPKPEAGNSFTLDEEKTSPEVEAPPESDSNENDGVVSLGEDDIPEFEEKQASEGLETDVQPTPPEVEEPQSEIKEEPEAPAPVGEDDLETTDITDTDPSGSDFDKDPSNPIFDVRNYGITISECPLVSTSWAAVVANYTDFINRMRAVHAQLEDAYRILENNFYIDMKFYNTYGKSRFYTVGLDDASIPLDDISCTFNFGIRTTTLSNLEEFLMRVRNFVKSYIEDIDLATDSAARDVYIMNMVSAIKEAFPEISYLIYYGFNVYDHMAQQIVGPDLVDYMPAYIPEFINLRIAYDADGLPYPDVNIVVLNR